MQQIECGIATNMMWNIQINRMPQILHGSQGPQQVQSAEHMRPQNKCMRGSSQISAVTKRWSPNKCVAARLAYLMGRASGWGGGWGLRRGQSRGRRQYSLRPPLPVRRPKGQRLLPAASRAARQGDPLLTRPRPRPGTSRDSPSDTSFPAATRFT